VARGSTKQARQAPDPQRRRIEIADAALMVLGTEGSRGLTHRAVDEAAGLPPGSTSNYFRTRDALLEAAALRHAELDMQAAADVDAALTAVEGPITREQAKFMILVGLDRIMAEETRFALIARFELTLEAGRRPSLAPVMAENRRHFAGIATALIGATGCETPVAHGAQLLGLMDGITADHLQPEPTLDREAIEALIDRFLAGC
jgi:DNA-binding transcriptional regulator YbjK